MTFHLTVYSRILSRGDRRTESSHLLVYSLNAYNSPGWTRLMLGDRISIEQESGVRL